VDAGTFTSLVRTIFDKWLNLFQVYAALQVARLQSRHQENRLQLNVYMIDLIIAGLT